MEEENKLVKQGKPLAVKEETATYKILSLLLEGYTYSEIARRTGLSAYKVQQLATEGAGQLAAINESKKSNFQVVTSSILDRVASLGISEFEEQKQREDNANPALLRAAIEALKTQNKIFGFEKADSTTNIGVLNITSESPIMSMTSVKEDGDVITVEVEPIPDELIDGEL